ncbi:MAG TPA: hypothetical protein VEJ89_06375 [Myxococcaceae bacterium]|nr:hypothetical protein [Myxococcaceae bacterium]
MKARGAALQGAIAAGALALAASVWLGGPPRPEAGAVIVDLPPGSVQRIAWEDGSHRVEVVRDRPGEPGAWVRIARSKSLLAPDAGQDGGAVPAAPLPDAGRGAQPVADGGTRPDAGRPALSRADAGTAPDAGVRGDAGVTPLDIAPPAPDRELRGNETAEKLLDLFSPFTAARALGVVDASKRRELGLENSPRQLEVWTPSAHLTFTISVPVGTGAVYLLTDDGRVFVLGGTLVQDLVSASSRLVDRRLHAFRPEEPDRLVVQKGAQSRGLLQRRQGAGTRITSESHPDTTDVYAQAWTERLVKIVPSDILGKGEVPPEGEPHVELRVDLLRGGRAIGFVEIARAGPAWFVRSEHTVGWLRVVGRAEALVHDAERVLSTP